jgi:hypothetical protein
MQSNAAPMCHARGCNGRYQESRLVALGALAGGGLKLSCESKLSAHRTTPRHGTRNIRLVTPANARAGRTCAPATTPCAAAELLAVDMRNTAHSVRVPRCQISQAACATLRDTSSSLLSICRCRPKMLGRRPDLRRLDRLGPWRRCSGTRRGVARVWRPSNMSCTILACGHDVASRCRTQGRPCNHPDRR